MDKLIADKIETFFSQYSLQKYPKGQLLILNGSPTSHVFHLEAGIVKQYDVSYRGDQIILNLFKPPAFFPMSLAINGGASLYAYEAKTALEVRQAPVEDVLAFVKENPDVLFDLLSRVYHGVDGLLARVTHLMSSSARERLLFELLIEARRFGKALSEFSYELTISEKELGARAGLSRETISREMSKLTKDGTVTINKHQIIIPDILAVVEKLG
jgi:CRP/FNR family transcriptional regulator